LEAADLRATFLQALPPPRRRVGFALHTDAIELPLCIVILFTLAIAVMESNAAAASVDPPSWITFFRLLILAVFSLELGLRVYVFRLYFFRNTWNLVDAVAVSVDLALNVLSGIFGRAPGLTVLRLLRLIRLATAYRVIEVFPELHIMVMGLAGTLRTVLWGIVLLCGFVVIFALAAVELIQPVVERIPWDDCDRCGRAYSTVAHAGLTFVQQIVAGDSWGLVTLPIVEEAPWTVLFFLAVMVTINLLVINLILAVVVEKAQQAHRDDQAALVREQAKEKQQQLEKARSELIKMCYAMDEDHSGCLTLEELLQGYDSDEYFAAALTAIDIDREDLATVFNILDKDGSGDIDYTEFVDQLHKLRTEDQHTLIIFIMHYIKAVQVDVAAMQADQANALRPKSLPQGSCGDTGAGKLDFLLQEVQSAVAAMRADEASEPQTKSRPQASGGVALDIAGLGRLMQEAHAEVLAQNERVAQVTRAASEVVARAEAAQAVGRMDVIHV